MARLYELLVPTCLNLFRRVWTRIILVDLYMKEDMGNINKVNKKYVGCYGDVNKGIN